MDPSLLPMYEGGEEYTILGPKQRLIGFECGRKVRLNRYLEKEEEERKARKERANEAIRKRMKEKRDNWNRLAKKVRYALMYKTSNEEREREKRVASLDVTSWQNGESSSMRGLWIHSVEMTQVTLVVKK